MNETPGDDEIARYRALLAQNPESLVFAALAEALRKRGRIGEAIEAARTGVLRHPGYLAGLIALAKCLYEAGDFAESLVVTERILQTSADHLAAMRLKGTIEQAQGNLTAAARTYKRILLVYPKDEATQGLLKSLEERRAPQGGGAAEDDTSEEITLATMTLVELFQKQGYRKRAREACQRILAQEPTRQDALRKLVELNERPLPPWMQARAATEGTA